ncbi:CU044_5270 family protein [Streptomyces sp. NPDC001401]|uniref:CU044_5270 family protein n=1 Tax=Streptomyces sp. NPDC001401 TaxID=3364570 RepID=UPI00368E6BDF
MDEMTKVRELRVNAPLPDRARLAPGRARLVAAARAGERRRAVWRRREFVIVGVVAAVTAVAVTVSLLVGGGGTGRRVQPAVTPSVSLEGVSAAEFLEQAADVLEAQPDITPPTAQKWIYTKQADESPDKQKGGLPWAEHEQWIRYDGSAMAFQQLDAKGRPLKIHVQPMHLENGGEGDDRSEREMYRVLAALPAGGEATLKVLREKNAIADINGASQAQNDYQEIAVLMAADVMPPRGLASLYRALAALPGGKVVDHLVKTASGRQVIALDFPRQEKGGSGRNQWLIDPQTYRIVGERLVEGNKILGGGSLVATAVVDKPGDRG